MTDQVRWPYFGDKFSKLLEETGVTLYRLDEDTPLRSSNMSKVARGTKRPTDDILKALSDYAPLNVSFLTLKGWRAIDEYGADAIEAAFKEAFKDQPDKLKEINEKINNRLRGKDEPDYSRFES